jgi:malate dehydrogenase (oxaloacetate-decarboxylating)
MEDIYRESLELHRKMRGKLEVRGKVPIRTRRDLSRAYTPGVAQVCREIEKDRNRAWLYTIKANTVAIVTDGSAVLGLGNIGGYAAIPVMEGKALLFKDFAGIDAFPICFEGYHTDFIDDVKNIAPVFGGINLEDIAAPKCFEVEDALQDIGIPVMHDDQHGTAVVILAALLNACRATGKNLSDITIAMSGAGAAGYATFRLLKCLGYDRRACLPVGDMIVCDTKGIIHRDRPDLLKNKYKYIIAHETNREGRTGTIAEALRGADVFIGVSAPGPNQINNVLAFPGIFRGALDARATRITDDMKLAAAHALAGMVKEPTRARVLPGPLNRRVAHVVASAVERAARECGCAVEIT